MSDGVRIQELVIEIAVVNTEIIEYHDLLGQVKGRKAMTGSAEFDRTELSMRRVIDRLEDRREVLLTALDEALAEAAPEGCTCNGMGVCTACVLTKIETEGRS